MVVESVVGTGIGLVVDMEKDMMVDTMGLMVTLDISMIVLV